MRIIAGKFKGKVLKEFELNSTRPTADLVRGALFNTLSYNVDDCVFLDLFSGTGAVGIEALSRGARECYFVDANKDAIKLISNNLKSINMQTSNVLNLDYTFALNEFCKLGLKFDIVFLDPPYATDFAENAINFIKNNDLLSNFGIIAWEHDNTKLQYIKENFKDSKTKKYGKKYLTFIAK